MNLPRKVKLKIVKSNVENKNVHNEYFIKVQIDFSSVEVCMKNRLSDYKRNVSININYNFKLSMLKFMTI